jgi:hypothetical protein
MTTNALLSLFKSKNPGHAWLILSSVWGRDKRGAAPEFIV